MEGYNPFSLKGKNILVTGASSGIGKKTAIECSKMGANLTITGRDKHRLQETMDELVFNDSQKHHQIIADITTYEGQIALIDGLSGLDGFVSCAGKALSLPAKFASKDRIDDILEVNFISPVELLSQLYKKKKLEKNASVVAVSALSGIERFSSKNSIYGASKAALSSFMRFCALEFAQRGIRVNCVCPGMVDTPLIHNGSITEEQLKADEEKYPMKRYGKPEDIAFMIIYLLSDAASWVTGQNFIIDGGSSIK